MTAMLDRRELVRWSVSAAIVVLAHAGAGAALVAWSERSEPSQPSAALVIDLAPMPAAPATPEIDLAPGPEQEQVDTPPEETMEVAEVEPPLEEPPPSPPDPDEPPPEPTPEPPPPEPDPEPPPPEIVMAPKPEVAIAEPPPKPLEPPKARPKPKPRPRIASAPRPNQQLTPTPVAPVQGQPTPSNSFAIPTWRNLLLAHLERHKRYPSEAQARREQGVAQVAFTIDRSGNVTSARLVRSSGYPALDEETLSMVRRASPVPAPPPEMGGSVSLTVPVRFNIR